MAWNEIYYYLLRQHWNLISKIKLLCLLVDGLIKYERAFIAKAYKTDPTFRDFFLFTPDILFTGGIRKFWRDLEYKLISRFSRIILKTKAALNNHYAAPWRF